jgi:hypothetical protein
MKLTPQDLFRFAETVQTFDALASVTQVHVAKISTEVALDGQPNAALSLEWDEDRYVITGVAFIAELPEEPEDEELSDEDAEAYRQTQEILDRFLKSIPGLGGVVNDEELIAQAPVKEEDE